ncbi:malto-oligosyltrehalose synthase [Kamptonema formosum]|uniref:malto-oligosyltrehalose synthase n=1 Tax=Kamptonema formosum TaxID=331992 RepID=UPI00034BED9A|nr:malto-oligosyltrehalose synthase [Oscillatoria sp. PCC 10802]
MRIPVATYRIQVNSAFNFEATKNLIPYLKELGISEIYVSPIFKARKGSSHGYDVVDHSQINPELGTPEELEALVSELQQRDMGWVQDIVPNHMAYDSQNLWLMDIMENGQDSDYSDYFDIEWNHPYEDIKGRVLAPMLGTFYGEALENGEIQLSYEESGLSVNYYSLKLPVRIESYSRFLTHNLGYLPRALGGRNHPDFMKFLGIFYLIKNLPSEPKGKERYDQLAFVKGLLWELYTQNPHVQEFIDSNVKVFNGEKGNPESFNLLDSLLAEQFYRLSFWKVGAEEINYRRFFTVNELICVKIQELKVFNKAHALVSKLVEEGKITGLRVDHIDGLYDPTEYLKRLRQKVGTAYITVEKILELKENLPEGWPIQGTSGYDFLNYLNGIFCRRETERKFTEIYSNFTDCHSSYQRLCLEKKHLIVDKNFAGDVDNLAQILKKIAGQSRRSSDFTLNGLKRTLSEVLALFPVYRTYVNGDGMREDDRAYIQEVIEEAKKRIPLLLNELNFIENLLLREFEKPLPPEDAQRLHFVMRLQQVTGPLMAKGIEDTLFYVYNRLISLNEVGGNPGKFGITAEEFHSFNQQQMAHWPHKMNATATHDTKRGEDARARLNVLSEIPEEWEKQVKRWSEINRSHKIEVGGRAVPAANDEYFFYQTLVGAFPGYESERAEFVGRVKDYMLKSVREAKLHTAWLRPDTEYEEGFLAFVGKVLDPSDSNEFVKEFLPFQKWVAGYGIFNSLSQTLLKIASPGVPDFYQGTELWDLSMVDPDNRRPVNFDRRIWFLQELKEKAKTDILKLLQALLSDKEDGRIKFFLTFQALQARCQNLEVFQTGDYQPLKVAGKFKEHIVAFARSSGDTTAIAVAPRFLTALVTPEGYPLGEQVWADTHIEIPQGAPSFWHNAITEQTISGGDKMAISEILQHFPVALLVSRRTP